VSPSPVSPSATASASPSPVCPANSVTSNVYGGCVCEPGHYSTNSPWTGILRRCDACFERGMEEGPTGDCICGVGTGTCGACFLARVVLRGRLLQCCGVRSGPLHGRTVCWVAADTARPLRRGYRWPRR
jgi:hypothetical protein